MRSEWPVRLINLNTARERLAWQIDQLSRLNISFERRKGVAGRLLPQKTLEQISPDTCHRQFKRALTPGEIGCYLSHILLWKEIAAGPHEVVVVLEDDVELGPDAADQLAALERCPIEWDILKLCYGEGKADNYGDCIIPVLRKKLPPATMGYAITRPAAAILVEKVFPISRPVDMDLRFWWEHGLCVKVAEPALGWQQAALAAASDIDLERSSYRRRTGLLKRFVANSRYQLMRRAHSLRHFGQAPKHRKAFDAGPRDLSLPPFLTPEIIT